MHHEVMLGGRFCPSCLEPVEETASSCPGCQYARPAAGWLADEYIGRMVSGKYRVAQRLGVGAFGVVVRARQIQGQHDLGDVVLKFLHPHIANRKSFRQRFVNEAKAARRLGSPHVVKVFDHDFDERGTPYIVMEYLRGQPLVDVIKNGALAANRVLRIALQITGALQECHDAGILHRDLKPANILLIQAGREDFIKIIDFGIAHLSITDDSTGTQTVLGTPKYMPPEQIRQQDLDEGADIFALGVILFECLCGESPIPAKTSIEYMSLNLFQAPRKLREVAPQMPETLESVLDSMMAKDRRLRPASMQDVEARLLAIGRQQGWLPYSMRMPAVTSKTAIQGGGALDPSDDTELAPPPSDATKPSTGSRPISRGAEDSLEADDTIAAVTRGRGDADTELANTDGSNTSDTSAPLSDVSIIKSGPSRSSIVLFLIVGGAIALAVVFFVEKIGSGVGGPTPKAEVDGSIGRPDSFVARDVMPDLLPDLEKDAARREMGLDLAVIDSMKQTKVKRRHLRHRGKRHRRQDASTRADGRRFLKVPGWE